MGLFIHAITVLNQQDIIMDYLSVNWQLVQNIHINWIEHFTRFADQITRSSNLKENKQFYDKKLNNLQQTSEVKIGEFFVDLQILVSMNISRILRVKSVGSAFMKKRHFSFGFAFTQIWKQFLFWLIL